MTHAELVARALKWVRNQCIIAFPELVSMNYEIPDVWGYGRGRSILIECKATRADFLADQKKVFRREADMGMGNYRFFMCPPDLISAEEIPAAWGLLYCREKIIKKVKMAQHQPANMLAERQLLASVVRRCALRWPIHEIQDINTLRKTK